MPAADRAGARPVTTAATIGRLRPSDYGTVIAVIDEWWGGRPMSDMVPRLFFEHFAGTSFAADRPVPLAGFLVGFLSQSQPAEAYIHFGGGRPGQPGQGRGRPPYDALVRCDRLGGAGTGEGDGGWGDWPRRSLAPRRPQRIEPRGTTAAGKGSQNWRIVLIDVSDI